MPYKVSGKSVLHKKDGWSVKQTCRSEAAAKRAMRLLEGLEHGSIKPSEVGKGKFAKKKRRT